MIPLTLKFRLRGDCMFPLLSEGDEVYVRQPGERAAREGEVLAYVRWTDGKPSIVAHRRVGSGVRADSRLSAEDPSRLGEPVGVVVAVRRNGTMVPLASPRGRAWDLFSRVYGRLFFCWWRELGLPLRRAAQAPAQWVFSLLFP